MNYILYQFISICNYIYIYIKTAIHYRRVSQGHHLGGAADPVGAGLRCVAAARDAAQAVGLEDFFWNNNSSV